MKTVPSAKNGERTKNLNEPLRDEQDIEKQDSSGSTFNASAPTGEFASKSVRFVEPDWPALTQDSEQSLHSGDPLVVELLLQHSFRQNSCISDCRRVDTNVEICLEVQGDNPTGFYFKRMHTSGKIEQMDVDIAELEKIPGMNMHDYQSSFLQKDRVERASCVVLDASNILIDVYNIRSLLNKDYFWVFSQDKNSARNLLNFLSRRLGIRRDSRSFSTASLQSADSLRNNSVECHMENYGLPFEWIVLEGVLDFAFLKLYDESSATEASTMEYLRSSTLDVKPTHMEQLAKAKQTCIGLKQKAERMKKMLDNLLHPKNGLSQYDFSNNAHQALGIQHNGETNELCSMTSANGLREGQDSNNTITKIKGEEQSRELLSHTEDVLKLYEQYATNIASGAEGLLSRIRLYERSTKTLLSEHRFQVTRLQLKMTLVAFAPALMTMFASIFSTNLKSGLESQERNAYIIVACIVLVVILLTCSFFKCANERKNI